MVSKWKMVLEDAGIATDGGKRSFGTGKSGGGKKSGLHMLLLSGPAGQRLNGQRKAIPNRTSRHFRDDSIVLQL